MKNIITIVILTFSLIQNGRANVPILPVMDIMGFPFLSAISTSGLALLVIILIEALVLQKRERLGYIKSLKLSGLANAFSTLLGGGIVISYSSSFAAMFGLIIGSIIFMFIFRSISQNIIYLKRFGQNVTLCFFAFFGLGIIVSVLGTLSMPLYNYFHAHHIEIHFSTSSKIFISIPAAIGLYLIGFILTVISESYIIKRYFPDKENHGFYTILIMNIVSYLVLLVYFLPFLFVRMLA